MKGCKIDAFITIGSSWPQRSLLNCSRALLGLAYSGWCTFTNSSTIVWGKLDFVRVFVFILRAISRQYRFIYRFVSVNTSWLQEHIFDGISFHMIITVAASRPIITCLLFLILSVGLLLMRMFLWTDIISGCIAKQDHSLLLFVTALLEYLLEVKSFDWDVFYVFIWRSYFRLETLAVATMAVDIESRLHD